MKYKPINIVIDNRTNEFIEIETDDGKSIHIGKVIHQGPYYKIRITELPKEEDE